MANLPLAASDWQRFNAQETVLHMRNRFFEQNPTGAENVALLSRPGLRRGFEAGEGPIRSMYAQPGSFNDDLFVISANEVYRVNRDLVPTKIGEVDSDPFTAPEMAATARFGDLPEYLYIADGRILWLYTENGFSRSILSGANATAVADNDEVRIGGIYYKFTSGSVDAGTPDGTVANPWLIKLETTTTDCFTNLAAAINGTGLPGTVYSTLTDPHPVVESNAVVTNQMLVRARVPGAVNNSVVTTETGANISWTAGTLQGGGTPSFTQVLMPDDYGAISLGVIANFVIIIPTQEPADGINGRFYYIEPGESIVRPDNFFTAEKSPDRITQVRVIGDQFWLFGDTSTEVWYATGDENFVFARVQGQAFDRGTWEGSATKVKDAVMVVDTEGVVYEVTNGPRRVSTHAVEERVRRAILVDFNSGV
jgi:hypothetical protein